MLVQHRSFSDDELLYNTVISVQFPVIECLVSTFVWCCRGQSSCHDLLLQQQALPHHRPGAASLRVWVVWMEKDVCSPDQYVRLEVTAADLSVSLQDTHNKTALLIPVSSPIHFHQPSLICPNISQEMRMIFQRKHMCLLQTHTFIMKCYTTSNHYKAGA